MNYQKIYNDLVSKRTKTDIIKTGYFERHHIVPKCMGGTNDSNNLVNLTLREHFIAHLLLCKIYKDSLYYSKLILCILLFKQRSKSRVNSRLYQKIRQDCFNSLSEINKIYYYTHKSSFAGKKHSTKTRSLMSYRQKQRLKNKETYYNYMKGKMWIHKDNKEDIIEEICEIPEGWEKGKLRRINHEKRRNQDLYDSINKFLVLLRKDCIEKRKKNCTRKVLINGELKYRPAINKVNEIRLWYNEYIKNGYCGVVEKFKYPYTNQNLCGIFKNYIPEFKPQPGKKRKS